MDHTTFDLVRRPLEHGFRLLLYDRRGHGASERPSRPWTISDEVEDLGALLEGLDLFPVHVAGNSLGGTVGIRLAARRPDLLRSLISHEAPLVDLLARRGPELERAREAMAEVTARVLDGDARGGAERFVDTVAMGPGAWERLSPRVQEALVANAPSWPPEYLDETAASVDLATLNEFAGPVLLTHGAESFPFFRELSEILAGAFPNATVRELLGTGHVPHLTHPTLFAGTLVDFCLERTVPTS